MKKPEKKIELHLRPREVETVTLEIPQDTLESLQKVATTRDMSCKALLKFYIGQGLRHDLSKLYADRVIETMELVLTRHLHSAEEISAIMQEIRVEAVG
jgi:transcriptional regulator of met regulon